MHNHAASAKIIADPGLELERQGIGSEPTWPERVQLIEAIEERPGDRERLSIGWWQAVLLEGAPVRGRAP